ncbi:MAG: hypothetical protein IJ379_01700 [Lachnospiraceae bacterium]|nr:hypothetical protein [Lachnospiraceae bacterium]
MEKIINIEDIIDVTKEGVLFKDTSGAVNKILFDECRRNWVEHVNQGGFVDWKGNPVHITFEESNYVGTHSRIGNLPYIILYGNNRLKIELKPRSEKQLTKVQREFHAMLYRVGDVATFDMS